MKCDVAIVGGGPAGTTLGTLLKKYDPELDVAIFERERFPREHVGESLLPMVPRILNEMGVWEKVEAAGFPIKLGGVYRWGKMASQDLFYFRFLGGEPFEDLPRPGKFEGQRTTTTFQVDRSVYDKILLDHAAEAGCQIFQEAKVNSITHSNDHIMGFDVVMPSGLEDHVHARYYVDASGSESLFRKTMGIGIQAPTSLRNIAIWDYWQNADWAEKHGNGTFIYVLSIGDGWLWFIPISATRTSIGFVTSADYFKRRGLSTEALYLEAVSREPLIREMTEKAAREGKLQATKDWSFISDRLYGNNWYLVGDAAGFADPILSAGLTLAQSSARRVAFTILEEQRGEVDGGWLKEQYQRVQKRNTLNHIRFADYWYSANEQFTELQEYCSQIAANAGVTLDPQAAFQWLSTGGFTDELAGVPLLGTYSLSDIKSFTGRFSGASTAWKVLENNIFRLNVADADHDSLAHYVRGRVEKLECLKRGEKVWPLTLIYKAVYNSLKRECEIQPLAEMFMFELQKEKIEASRKTALLCLETLESLVAEGWVAAHFDPSLPLLDVGGNELTT
jgi:flavin-dependent dehydrogenase